MLHEMEQQLAHSVFAGERRHYEARGRRSLARVERWIPLSFGLLYLALSAACVLG